MLACEVNLPPPRAQPPTEIVQPVSAHTHTFILRPNANVLNSQDEDGSLIFVPGAEAITPKYLILYSKSSVTPPTGSHGRTSMYS